MKKLSVVILFLITMLLSSCSVDNRTANIINTYSETPYQSIQELVEKSEMIITTTHYEMSDNTWKANEYTYKYRLEITGRLHNSVKDKTYIVLSNTKDISFEDTWKASGLSSNSNDYFKPETAVIVGVKSF